MKINNFAKFVITFVLTELVGAMGSFFTVSSVSNWYLTFAKPPLNPSSWLFGSVFGQHSTPLWAWRRFWFGERVGKKKIRIAVGVFGLQLF